jgi:hypothetical protein
MGRRVSVAEAAELCKQAGGCSEGEVALWLGVGTYTAYRLFKQLRDLCLSGALNTEEEVCELVGDRVIFRRRGEGSGGKGVNHDSAGVG